MSSQDSLHRQGQIVIANASEDSAQVLEGQLVRFQKRLLRRALVSPMKGASARHAAQRENVQLLPLPAQVGIRLIEICLRFAAPLIALRYKSLAAEQAQRLLLLPHIPADRRFA